MSADLLKTLEINVLGPLKTVRALVPVMKGIVAEEEGKKVMLLSSALGSLEEVKIKGDLSPTYSVSKVSHSCPSGYIPHQFTQAVAFARPLSTCSARSWLSNCRRLVST